MVAQSRQGNCVCRAKLYSVSVDSETTCYCTPGSMEVACPSLATFAHGLCRKGRCEFFCGGQFVFEEMHHFMKKHGIQHTRVPRYHPTSNGEAERYVQILKQAFQTSKIEPGKSLQLRLPSFLFSYRNTPYTVTGQTPAELFLKRTPRTRLSLLHTKLAQHVEEHQTKVKQQHDAGRFKTRDFLPGDLVLVRNFRGKDNWQRGTVICG